MRKLHLQQRHDRAASRKGQARVRAILEAARDLLIEEGYQSLTLRKIAARCGIKVGNLNYYFANKKALLYDLVDAVIEGYMDDFNTIIDDPSKSPEAQFDALLRFIMEDLTTKETTRFFPELWVLANHDAVAADAMERIYSRERAVFVKLIARINPTLNQKAREVIALYISASIEGMTVFVGHNRTWRRRADSLINLAARAFLDLVTQADNSIIENLPRPIGPQMDDQRRDGHQSIPRLQDQIEPQGG